MSALSALIISRVIAEEGGYVDDPKDPGGETKYGISKRSYPNVDIKNLTPEQAAAIYQRDWWDRYGFDRVPERVSAKLFDAAVNIGMSPAIRCLQRALRANQYQIVEDGELKAETLALLLAADPFALLSAYRSELASYYRLIIAHRPDQIRFLNGWLNRAYAP